MKPSLAPGSQVVVDYYERSGLMPYLEKLGFHVVGFGCTTCIGNSGPLAPEISEAVGANGLAVAAVLSGNRNFEGRINPDVRLNYLASPPLVVAYALAGTMDWDPYNEPIGTGHDGPVYLREAGLTPYLEQLKFHLVGYGCTTCIGNSGPLPAAISKAIEERDLVAVSVLSGNRNFEGRINSEVRANYLASPPLVVAYALAGRIDVDLQTEPLGTGKDGQPVYLKDVWPTRKEVEETVLRSLHSDMFRKEYADVFTGDEHWNGLDVPAGDTYAWDPESTYVRHPPYFENMPEEPAPVQDVHGARVLAVFADSITTDHISPAGSIKAASPAGKYLVEHGVPPKDFNSYGARRGNHEVMVRGTFANVRIRNKMTPEIEGGFTTHLPSGEPMTIYDAAMKYLAAGVPTVVLAGKEYGTGSSRDWAAKGPRLQGVRAVIAETFERIHRSNLVGMGVAPLEFLQGDTVQSLGLTGFEVFEITGLAEGVASDFAGGREVSVRATDDHGKVIEFKTRVRLDTPQEMQYYRHGGILHYVLRQLLKA